MKRPPQADRAWPSADVATYDRTGGVATPDVSKKGGTHSSREGAGSLTEGQWAQLVEELPSKPFATLAGRFVHTFYTKLDNPADERILKYGTHFTKFIQELNEYQAQWQAGGRSLTYNLGTRVVQERACEFAEPAKGMYQMELMWLSRDFLKELLSVKKYYYSTKKHSKRPLGTYIGLERRVL